MMLATPGFLDDCATEEGLEAVHRVWAKCGPAAEDHPYLAKHGLVPYGLRLWKGCLIAPLLDAADQLIGLFIVDVSGVTRTWLPIGGIGAFVIGTPSETVIVAATTLADALALHEISRQRVLFVTSRDDIEVLKRRVIASNPNCRVLIAGLSMVEASAVVPPGQQSTDFIFPPPNSHWACLRLHSGAEENRSWVDDPIMVFGGVVPGPTILTRASGTWVPVGHGRFGKIAGPVMPIAMMRSEHNAAWSRVVWMRNRDHAEQFVTVPERDILMSPKRALMKLVDAGLDVENPGILPCLINVMRDAKVSPRLHLVQRGGWHARHYVAKDGTFGDPVADMPVRAECPTNAPAASRVELAAWQRDIAVVAEGNSRLVLALCAGFAGLAIGLRPQQGGFGIHLRGLSSTGKTSALAVAASIYGPANRVICSWRATDNGLEAIAIDNHHRLLILDEIAQIDARAAAQIGYTLANGQGKQRANGGGRSAKGSAWQLVFLSSGEISLEDKIAEWSGAPTMREGQAVRVMDLAADACAGLGLFDTLNAFGSGAAFSDHLKTAAERSTGDVALTFLEHLTRDPASASQRLADLQARFLTDHLPPNADGITRRGLGNFALLAAAGEIAINAGILPWAQGHAMEQVARCAHDWLAAIPTDEPRDEIEVARRWLQHHADRLVPWEIAGSHPQTEIGYLRKDPLTFYLRPTGWNELCAGGDAKSIQLSLVNAGLMRNHPIRLPGGGLIRVRIIDGMILGSGGKGV